MRSIKIISVIFLFFAGSTLFAQIDFGAKAGVSISNLKFSDGDADTKSLTGLTLGAFAMYSISEQIQIHTGLIYTGKGCGFKIAAEDEFEGEDPKINISYLNIPIHGVYKIPVGGGFSENHVLISAGPYLGYAMSAKATPSEIGFNVNRLDLGFDVGAGFQFGKFLAQAQYSMGLSNIGADFEDSYTAKNQTISITLGYVITDSGF
jgi:Outer membrane protein beta-barrel domain